MARRIIRPNDFPREAAEFIIAAARNSLRERGEFRIALSGGNTPRPVYRELASSDVPWANVIVTFGDERCVPPEDDQSNFKMADETLLRPAGVPPSSVLRMRGEGEPRIAAEEYENELVRIARARSEKIYQHDLILLGIGEDGHTASLFPGTDALREEKRLVVANFVPKLNSWRLTFTLPLIAAARTTCFLVKAKSADLIEDIFAGDESLPATRVDKEAHAVTWIIGD